MASPEELSEWLQSEEKREARPTPPTSPGGAAGGVGSSGEAGADLEAQLRAFTTQTSRTERRMGALEQMMQVWVGSGWQRGSQEAEGAASDRATVKLPNDSWFCQERYCLAN